MKLAFLAFVFILLSISAKAQTLTGQENHYFTPLLKPDNSAPAILR